MKIYRFRILGISTEEGAQRRVHRGGCTEHIKPAGKLVRFGQKTLHVVWLFRDKTTCLSF